MHKWMLYKESTPPAMIESNDFAAEWRRWRAMAQKGALSTLAQHYKKLEAALQMLEKSVG
jgi:hypothetical protein